MDYFPIKFEENHFRHTSVKYFDVIWNFIMGIPIGNLTSGFLAISPQIYIKFSTCDLVAIDYIFIKIEENHFWHSKTI